MSAETALREIPFSRPDFDDAEARAVSAVLATGWVSQGPRVAEFERLFAARVGARDAVAVSSCTTALHLAVILAGVGPGDEVIVPSYTFVATANAVLYVNATPVFAEIEPDTWNLDPADVARRVTPRTKAVIVVHQFGLPARMPYDDLAARGIRIIEDAACVVGGRYEGQPIGSRYDACWSFHPRKTISTGEGGMLTTQDPAAAERARQLRSFAASVSDRARHEARGVVFEEYRELGYNYRLTDLQAAVGIAQLAKLDALLAARARLADAYNNAFRNVPGLHLPAAPPYGTHTFQTYGVRVEGWTAQQRDAALRAMVERGISCRRGIPPVHLEPLYLERCGRVSLPVSEQVADSSLLLPMFASLTRDDQARVIDTFIAVAAGR